MNPELLERYSRNLVLPEIGGLGQKRLSQSRVLIIGAGGLGGPALLYLAASGIGRLGVVDFDTVSLSNLQRQVLFDINDIGKLKVKSAQLKLNSLNPNIEIVTYPFKLSEKNIKELFIDYDLILDGTDNYSTRYLINRQCFKQNKPLLFGAVSQWDGQISFYDPKKKSACFECLFPVSENVDLESNCSSNGVLGPLVGVIGALMATEAIKFISGVGNSLTNEIMLYDALSGQMRRYKTQLRTKCKVCGIS